jgi:hypothetical protein
MPERLLSRRVDSRLLRELLREFFVLRVRFLEVAGIVKPPHDRKRGLISVCEGGIWQSSLILGLP